ncbi:hypothetical protein JR316_0010073 [Psilocybe cubensis]|uniref:Uncharacterized protein n=1 Tax=Psilocybe cubensis TaxID=181762 RepID=A0ACB8GQJ7_PSICU|nr:hypothetical protein JR316_0010073 [Psilocybe cubensis]KAH9477841.1 hypothetical protein JR316_0010073 [Psilocybe cubensis]
MGYGEPMVIVNNFAFCKKHGDEYCYPCFYDHRDTNNFTLLEEPALRDIGDNGGVYSMDSRESINVYELGAIPIGDGEDCKCRKQLVKDCKECFDWVKHILNELEEAKYRAKWLKKREKYYRNRED